MGVTTGGILPKDWGVKALGEIALINRINVVPSLFPKDQFTHFSLPSFDSGMSAQIESGREIGSSKFKVPPNAVLVSKLNPRIPRVWAPVSVPDNAVASTEWLVLTPRSEVERGYLYAICSSPMFLDQISSAATGTTGSHQRVSPDAALKIHFRFAKDRVEQRAIATALSDVDALLGGLDRLVAKKRDLKQAAMQQLLTGQARLPGFHREWAVKRLGELGSTYGGLTGKNKADFGSGSAKYVTFMNVMTNTVVDHSMFDSVRVSPSENQNRVERGDLLLNGSSETPEEVALCAIVATEVKDLFLNSFCFGFRPKSDAGVDGLFLTCYIRSTEGREIMKSLAQGSTRYNVSKRAFLEAAIRLPSLSEQSAIAGVLADMDAEITALEARRDKARALKQGMMQELLTGRTRLV